VCGDVAWEAAVNVRTLRGKGYAYDFVTGQARARKRVEEWLFPCSRWAAAAGALSAVAANRATPLSPDTPHPPQFVPASHLPASEGGGVLGGGGGGGSPGAPQHPPPAPTADSFHLEQHSALATLDALFAGFPEARRGLRGARPLGRKAPPPPHSRLTRSPPLKPSSTVHRGRRRCD